MKSFCMLLTISYSVRCWQYHTVYNIHAVYAIDNIVQYISPQNKVLSYSISLQYHTVYAIEKIIQDIRVFQYATRCYIWKKKISHRISPQGRVFNNNMLQYHTVYHQVYHQEQILFMCFKMIQCVTKKIKMALAKKCLEMGTGQQMCWHMIQCVTHQDLICVASKCLRMALARKCLKMAHDAVWYATQYKLCGKYCGKYVWCRYGTMRWHAPLLDAC